MKFGKDHHGKTREDGSSDRRTADSALEPHAFRGSGGRRGKDRVDAGGGAVGAVVVQRAAVVLHGGAQKRRERVRTDGFVSSGEESAMGEACAAADDQRG